MGPLLTTGRGPILLLSEEFLATRLKSAFQAREQRWGSAAAYCRAFNGDQDGLPGTVSG